MTVYKRDNLPACLSGFENINRYYDLKNDVYTAKILPGEFYVSKTGEMISTVLGSCISACIRDPLVGIGGMNHFMLPIDRRAKTRTKLIDTGVVARYGDFAMEMLVNAILIAGGKRKNLEVKLFGGGRVMSNMTATDIGAKNINFAHHYLDYEELAIVAEDVGDIYPRKVNYYSATGKVMVMKLLQTHNTTVSDRENNYYNDILKSADNTSDVEVFQDKK